MALISDESVVTGMDGEVIDEEVYYCFADFEFTCGERIHRNQAEMLSVGIVVCDSDYEIAETYYNTACPVKNSQLTSRCRKLTGLSQDEIFGSPDSNSVVEQVLEILADYGITEVRVWGNYDKHGLIADAKQHRRTYSSCDCIEELAEMVVDVQDDIVKKLGLPEAINIEELAGAFGFRPEEGSFHNAFNDAMGLYAISKGAYKTDFARNKALRKLIDDRAARQLAMKAEAARKRKELALSVPLTEQEKSYLDGFAEGETRDAALGRLINMRYAVIKRFGLVPDCERFVMICFDEPRRIKVIPEEEYSEDKSRAAAFSRTITRERFADALLEAVKG